MSYRVIEDSEYNYLDKNGQEGKCHLKIFYDGNNMLCVATEIDSNTGMSVTNAAENIATKVYQEYVWSRQKNVNKFDWVEHYPVRGTKFRPIKEEYCLVNFNWDNGKAYHPNWRKLGGKSEFDDFLSYVFSEKKTVSISEFRKRFFAGIAGGDTIKKVLEEHFDRTVKEMKNECY